MKRYLYFLYAGFFIFLCVGFIFGSTLLEKERAREQIVLLKSHIKEEENAYKLAIQDAVNEEEKSILTTQYVQSRHNLFKQIRQQRDIINDYSTEKWLWDSAKVIGPIAIMSLIAYQLLKTSPQEITLATVESKKTEEPELVLLEQPIPEQPKLLSKEEIERYKKIRNVHLGLAGWLALAERSSWLLFPAVAPNPFLFFLAGAAATSSLIYHIKTWPENNPIPKIFEYINPH